MPAATRFGRFAPGPHAKFAVVVALCLILMNAPIWWVAAGLIVSRQILALSLKDFAAFYAAGHLIAIGHGRLIYSQQAIAATERVATGLPVTVKTGRMYFNPPFFALLFVPLSRLPFKEAYLVWTALSLGVLAGGLGLIWKITSAISVPWRLVMLIATVMLIPVAKGLLEGQFSLILMVAWGGAYLALRSNHDRRTGVALAFLLVKPETLAPLALLLVWKRRYRVFFTLAPLSLAAAVVSAWIVGITGLVRYLLYLIRSVGDSNGSIQTDKMIGWNGLLYPFRGIFSVRFDAIPLLVLVLLTLAGLAAAWRGPLRTNGRRFAYQWAAVALATLLLDQHLYSQDLVVLLPCTATVIAAASPHERVRVGSICMLGWLIASRILYAFPPFVFTIYMVSVLGLSLRACYQRRTADEPLLVAPLKPPEPCPDTVSAPPSGQTRMSSAGKRHSPVLEEGRRSA